MPWPQKRLFASFLAALALALTPVAWCTPKYKVLHSFGSGTDGAGLWSSLVFDQKGNLYGTTSGGGEHETGIVFQLTPRSDGSWQETVLYNFCSQGGSDCTDGKAAFGGPTLDSLGNIYGTTQVGGPDHYGTVYELTQEDGNWTETVIHGFNNADYGGGSPGSGVTIDAAGNLYGTAGGVYELSYISGGWNYDVLHDFCMGDDGCEPYAGVIRDSYGNLYGTTFYGGGSSNCGGGCGTVYKLHPKPDGSWQETVLHGFQAGEDGAFPGRGALIIDASGSIYGTTEIGGQTGSGTIFRINRDAHGHWQETILYSIQGGNSGDEPAAGVVMDKTGALYGTTNGGGAQGCGTVYKLAPPKAKGKWKYTVLHSFDGNDGCYPDANLIFDTKGNLYGTATLGGLYNFGVAFELTP